MPAAAADSGKVAIICLASASVTPVLNSMPTDSAPTKAPSAFVVMRNTIRDGGDALLASLLSSSEPRPSNISTSATVLPVLLTVVLNMLYLVATLIGVVGADAPEVGLVVAPLAAGGT